MTQPFSSWISFFPLYLLIAWKKLFVSSDALSFNYDPRFIRFQEKNGFSATSGKRESRNEIRN